jgi:hypothetical protein
VAANFSLLFLNGGRGAQAAVRVSKQKASWQRKLDKVFQRCGVD